MRWLGQASVCQQHDMHLLDGLTFQAQVRWVVEFCGMAVADQLLMIHVSTLLQLCCRCACITSTGNVWKHCHTLHNAFSKLYSTILTADRVQPYSCKDMFMVQIYNLVKDRVSAVNILLP